MQEENRFLGGVKIPIQALLTNNGKMDFNFKIDRPLALPSYRVIGSEIYFAAQDPNNIKDEVLRKNEQLPTYLNMSISLDPPISLPSEN